MKRTAYLALAWLSTLATGALAASDSGHAPAWNPSEVTAAISETLRGHVFDPAQTASPAYLQTMERVQVLASSQPHREAYVKEFNQAWGEGPFSHVRLAVARANAAQTADYLDQLRVGGGGASLAWQGDVAILTVNTMMGVDTIEQIGAAYQSISERGARALVVDLRGNEGGAFAVVPLVSHVLAEPLEAGVFLGSGWFARKRPSPLMEEMEALPAWRGWSLKAFWADVESQGILRIRFEPAAPAFSGPVYVLTSRRTASAAELAADALQARGRALVIGEVSAGQMLSQKMYDVPGGLQLSLPVADYVSHHGGRIEGQGVSPDVVVPAGEALERALAMARSQDDSRPARQP
ncbi:MAG: hypothetical protein A3E01_01535 [Gammaproteobacteria bacterium RIFCSPHIGHO2_12_FULL_63_22]|nr:MAG: hypothetical protein A3E01_01535 [Gammaproteobacteria bacterium RIFCSPHIGHO2_12_FULL_63_22]